jgi:hypothetical protein
MQLYSQISREFYYVVVEIVTPRKGVFWCKKKVAGLIVWPARWWNTLVVL